MLFYEKKSDERETFFSILSFSLPFGNLAVVLNVIYFYNYFILRQQGGVPYTIFFFLPFSKPSYHILPQCGSFRNLETPSKPKRISDTKGNTCKNSLPISVPFGNHFLLRKKNLFQHLRRWHEIVGSSSHRQKYELCLLLLFAQ